MENELDILFSEEFGRSVEAALGRDPVAVALDRRVPYAALVASQVKYLRRAAAKLPSWYAARCILPARAFEQASSEAAAAKLCYSDSCGASSGVAIDLTCGLGVDSYRLSRRFGRVIAIERDPFLAAVARENFRRLGARNIEVIHASAEEFLSDFDLRDLIGGNTGNLIGDGAGDLIGGGDGNRIEGDNRVEMIYADPDRRGSEGKNEGRKLVRIEDCSPNVIALLPRVKAVARRLVVKLSPLFDVDEVFRIFGPDARVEVISVGGECKQIVAGVTFDAPFDAIGTPPASKLTAVAIDPDGTELSYCTDPDEPDCGPAELLSATEPFAPERYRWLVVPDVALQKARLARRYFSERGVWIDSDKGYGFAATDTREIASTSTPEPPSIMGKVLEIEAIEPFDPKNLKRRLKAAGIKNIDILKRDFPLSTGEIARLLGIREGGVKKIAFTRVAGRLWQITLKS